MEKKHSNTERKSFRYGRLTGELVQMSNDLEAIEKMYDDLYDKIIALPKDAETERTIAVNKLSAIDAIRLMFSRDYKILYWEVTGMDPNFKMKHGDPVCMTPLVHLDEETHKAKIKSRRYVIYKAIQEGYDVYARNTFISDWYVENN